MCIIPLRFPGKPASSSIFISHPPDCLHFSSDVSAPYCVSLLILKTGEPLTWSSGACPLVCWWPDVCQVSPASGRAVSVVWQCHRCQVMQGRRGTQGMWCDVTRVTTDKLSWGAALSPGGVSAVWHWAGKKTLKSWKEDTEELERSSSLWRGRCRFFSSPFHSILQCGATWCSEWHLCPWQGVWMIFVIPPHPVLCVIPGVTALTVWHSAWVSLHRAQGPWHSLVSDSQPVAGWDICLSFATELPGSQPGLPWALWHPELLSPELLLSSCPCSTANPTAWL